MPVIDWLLAMPLGIVAVALILLVCWGMCRAGFDLRK